MTTDSRPLKDQFADGYVYFDFCAASQSFEKVFRNLKIWQGWLDKSWERLVALRLADSDDQGFKEIIFEQSRMVFTKMRILEQCQARLPAAFSKGEDKARLVSTINQVIDDNLVTDEPVDWDNPNESTVDGVVVWGYEDFTTLAVEYVLYIIVEEP